MTTNNAPAAIATLPDQVRWSEGMLLSPQHFQQDRLFWQAHVRRQIDSAGPDLWGVRTLDIDLSSLASGCVAVTALECLMPDGALVQFPGNASQPVLSLNVAELCKIGGGPLRIYLQMPRSMTGKPGRYVEADATPDLDHSGEGDPVSVERMRLRFELKGYAVDHGKPADVFLCPLIEVELTANGMQLRDYHPPMLRLDAGDFLKERAVAAIVGQLTQKMWLKIDELASANDEGLGVDDLLSGAGSAQLNAARVLASGLPLLDLSVNDKQLHPRELYRALAAVVGPMSALGGHPLPFKMAPYAHDDCMPQFRAVCQYIESRIDSLHADYERHRFTPFKEGFSRRLFEEMNDDVIIELKPQAGQTLTDMAHWLKAANIASADMLLTVQAQRQNGALVHQLSSADARKLRLPVDAALFMLKNTRILSKGENAYQAGAPLMIQGGNRAHMPAQIFLYRRKRHARIGTTTVSGYDEEALIAPLAESAASFDGGDENV